jgi:hypothetical protein
MERKFGNGKSAPKRVMRSKKQASELKKLLGAEGKAGKPVGRLAKKHGIRTACFGVLQK